MVNTGLFICFDLEELKKMEEKKRSSFTGKLGYVLSAAGASVGLGNIWRFPYLAAKYGGGIFLLVYICLALTFGYTMIISETAIGRISGKSPVSAFQHFGKSLAIKFGGWINAIIPMLIVPYYSVIGGWVCKYLFNYLIGKDAVLADPGYFSSFITNGTEVTFWFVLFSAMTLLVIFMGVQNGIEKVSKIMMPVLVILAVLVAIYSMTRPGALAGVKYLLVPDFSRFSWMTVVAALGQMFYSLSIAMGILITFGSYMKKDTDMEVSSLQVELTDTVVAVLAGLMVIPAVFAFSGGNTKEILQSGPSLMFVTLPQVFASMKAGRLIGFMFFLLVLFAALTSSIALTESVVSTFEDEAGWSRKKGTVIMAFIQFGLGILSCLGFGPLANIQILHMDLLDFFDFLTNSIMMPVAAICTCVLVLRHVGLKAIEQEVIYIGSSRFRLRRIYAFVLKYLSIIFVVIILLSSILSALGIIKI